MVKNGLIVVKKRGLIVVNEIYWLVVWNMIGL